MAKIQFVNSPAVAPTLGADLSNSATSIAVSDASFLSATPNIAALIENELVLITARAGNTLTIARAQEGTTAAAHAAGKAMYFPLTAAGIASADRSSVMSGGEIITPDQYTWTWGNQGTGAAQKTCNGTILIDVPQSNTDAISTLVRPVTGAFTVTALIDSFFHWSGYVNFGLLVYDTVSNHTQTFGITCDGPSMRIKNWTGWGGTSGDQIVVTTYNRWYMPLWIQISDDGTTNRTYRVAIDGTNFVNIWTTTRGQWVAPNRVGFYIDPRSNGGTHNSQVRCLSWQETTP
jgi:hypothetical protein